MEKPFSFELRIALIMLVVLALVSITGIFAYQRFTNIVETVSKETRPDLRLVTVKSLLYDISEAEISIKSYSLTDDTVYLDLYKESVINTQKKLASLYELNNSQHAVALHLDTLDILIAKKNSTYSMHCSPFRMNFGCKLHWIK